MNFWNQNRAVSRIGGIREDDLVIVTGTGSPQSHALRGTAEVPTQSVGTRISTSTGTYPYKATLVEHDYVYQRTDLVDLEGNTYKSKRTSYNQFLRNHPAAVYRPFIKEDIPACLYLYQTWLAQYKERHPDSSASSFDKLPSTPLRAGRTLSERLVVSEVEPSESNGLTTRKHETEMAEENFKVHQKTLLEHEKLGLTGRVVELDGEIAGYTFGVPLSLGTFYVTFEITDLRNKGISQYLFREFCRELEPYEYIHAGGDSGVISLVRVKESYHPVKKHPVYQVTMNYFS
jgi:hypothetical protein